MSEPPARERQSQTHNHNPTSQPLRSPRHSLAELWSKGRPIAFSTDPASSFTPRFSCLLIQLSGFHGQVQKVLLGDVSFPFWVMVTVPVVTCLSELNCSMCTKPLSIPTETVWIGVCSHTMWRIVYIFPLPINLCLPSDRPPEPEGVDILSRNGLVTSSRQSTQGFGKTWCLYKQSTMIVSEEVPWHH